METCEECNYMITIDEYNAHKLGTQYNDDGTFEVDIECPRCGHINTTISRK